ncbi:MAG: phosphotransferase [Vibrio sp.]
MTTFIQNAFEQEPTLKALHQWSLQHQADDPIIYAKPINGGLTNRCWQVSAQCGRQYIWRPHSPFITALSVSRSNEFCVLKALQPYEIAPDPETLIVENGQEIGLLVEWLSGCVLSETDSSQTQIQDNVIACLAQLHQIQIKQENPIRTFEYAKLIEHYWQALPAELHTADAAKRFEWFASSSQQLDLVTSQIAAPCLCHFDLGDYNIIQTKEKNLKVIDWEYAAIANPILDVAISALAGEFDLDTCIQTYASHFTAENIDIQVWQTIALQWIPYLHYMMLLWYQLSFAEYGRASDQAAIELLNKQSSTYADHFS